MKVLVLEENLLWGPRLRQTLVGLGHEPVLASKMPEDIPAVHAAVVNLSARSFSPEEAIRRLKEAGIHVIGHAGHKEAELLQMGRDAGCDQVLTNGQTAFSLEKALDLVVLLD